MDVAAPHPFTFLLVAAVAAASCSAGNCLSESGGGSSSSLFIAILVAANGVVLVVFLFLLIIYYKKYMKLKRESIIPPREREHDSTILDRAPEAVGLKGKLVFTEKSDQTIKFELDDLFRSSAQGLGRGNFGNCYKAMLETGQAVVVKRLIDLKPLSSEEFERQVRATETP